MSEDQYNVHLKKLGQSFQRKGTVPFSLEVCAGDIAVLDELESITRYGLDDNLSDIPGTLFEDTFMSMMRQAFFKDYLEYRKIYQEMSLEEWTKATKAEIEARGYSFNTSDGVEVNLSEPEESDDEPVYEYEEELDFSSVYSLFSEEPPVHTPTFYTDIYGTTDDGYDIWVLELPSISEVNFHDLEEPSTPTRQLLTKPLGIGTDGYDLWYDIVEPVTSVLLSTHFGSSDDGYDVWHESHEDAEKPIQPDPEDGWGGEEQPEPGLGVLLSECYGVNESGYDIWHEPDSDPSTVLTLYTEVQGTSSDGYDIWHKPSSAKSSLSSLAGVPTRSDVSNGATNSTPTKNAMSNVGSVRASVSTRPRSAEDVTVETIESAVRVVGKIGKKFHRFLIG